MEQAHAQSPFQTRDALTNRRTCLLHTLGGVRKAACFNGLHESSDTL
jgi:hypothetical protein